MKDKEASALGLSDAIAWVTKRRDDYIEEFGHVDPDTGALEYGTGKHAEAKREYVGELDEIIEGLQSLTRASAATVAEASEPLWDRKGNVRHDAVERFGEARAQMRHIEQEHAAKSPFQREVEKMGQAAQQQGENK